MIALGGANFEADMGRPYLEHFEFIDFIGNREADTRCRSPPVRAWETSRPAAQRCHGAARVCVSHEAASCAMVVEPAPSIDFESSRLPLRRFLWRGPLPTVGRTPFTNGCLSRPRAAAGGARTLTAPSAASTATRCVFAPRAPAASWPRPTNLVASHGTSPLQFADNILRMDYFGDLLPVWAARRMDRSSSRSSGTSSATSSAAAPGRGHVGAGRRREPLGHTLRVMRKGVSAAQNIALLRWWPSSGLTRCGI